jgi:hypothetical protein
MLQSRTFMRAGVLFITGLFLTATACGSLFGVAPRPAPTLVSPTATAMTIETEVAAPLFQQVRLSSSPWMEEGQLPGYKIAAQTPVLLGSDDPRVTAFNSEMAGIVRDAAADFKSKLAELLPAPNSTASTFDLRFNLVSPPGDILSLKFDMQTYYAGAAHPGDTSRTINFDLEQGRELALADLFQPGADFLAVISKYCNAQLNTRDIGFQGFELGATATAANYRNWNIIADGLMVTFDEYQVAPYAAGPQTVIIPYSELAQIIRPDGALGAYIQ